MRSSIIGGLSTAGREAARAHGIRTVIDLRTDDEVAETPSPYRDGFGYRRAPFTVGRTMGLHRAAADGTMSEQLWRLAVAGGGLTKAISALAECEPGVVIHCMAGRDRTGIVIAIVLSAIGVPDDEIVADYVASDRELESDYMQFKPAHPDQVADVDAGIERRAWTMEQVLATLRRSFGGAAAYLRTAGVTDAQIDAIRAKLTA